VTIHRRNADIPFSRRHAIHNTGTINNKSRNASGRSNWMDDPGI